MKPYYEHGGITIYCGDCREILPTLPKVDLVLTDPPYGNETDYASFNDTRDELTCLLHDAVPLILNAGKRIMITPGVANIHLYPKPDWTLAWASPAGAGSGPWGFCCWQPILAYGKCPYLAAGLGRRADLIVSSEAAEKNAHPCPKPIHVWVEILKRGSTNDFDAILDPFLGSGTTLVAAKRLGRRGIGIEVEEKYCEIAAQRIEAERLTLFEYAGIEQSTFPFLEEPCEI